MQDFVKKLLVPVAILLAAGSMVLAWTRVSKHEQLLDDGRKLQPELNNIQMRQLVFRGLAQDLLAYSQQNPNIDAVLVPMGLKAAPARPQTDPPAQPQQPSAGSTTTPRR
ncbi:MAG: hypothetical protein HZA88_03035 [Verrucomicrobia bacterium]|nr:hypothetical protein [Verrucomicrobiota bacterium]